ncbi:hypothetical protein JXR93_12745, partial [bacterium]|nr:hypothetical protein [bacterium]
EGDILEGDILEGDILDSDDLETKESDLNVEISPIELTASQFSEEKDDNKNSLIQENSINDLKLDFSSISTSPKISQKEEPLAFLNDEFKLDFVDSKNEIQKLKTSPSDNTDKNSQNIEKSVKDRPKLNFLAAFEDEGIAEYVDFEEKTKETKESDLNTDSFLNALDLQLEKKAEESNQLQTKINKIETSSKNSSKSKKDDDYMLTSPEDFLSPEDIEEDDAIEIDIQDESIQSIPPLKKELDIDLDEFSLTDPGAKKDNKKTPPPIQKENKKPALPKKDGEQKQNSSTSMLPKQPSFTKNHKKFTEETDPKIPIISEEEAAKKWLKKQKEQSQSDFFEPLDILSNQDPMKNEEIDKIIFENELKPFKENFLKQLSELKIKKESYTLFENMFLTIDKNPLNLLFFATIETLIIKNRLSIDDILKVIQSHLENS